MDFLFYFCSAGKIYALPLLSASSSSPLIPKLLLNKYQKNGKSAQLSSALNSSLQHSLLLPFIGF